jgi:hypothetical protein
VFNELNNYDFAFFYDDDESASSTFLFGGWNGRYHQCHDGYWYEQFLFSLVLFFGSILKFFVRFFLSLSL